MANLSKIENLISSSATSQDTPAFYTKKELAKILRLSESYIERLVRARSIPFVKFGRLLRFKKADVDRWINDGGNNSQIKCVFIPSVRLETKNKKGTKHGKSK